MKTFVSPVRLTALLASLALATSCTTTYDAYGSPRQSVDPGVAVAGVAAAGLIGYALANDNRRRTSYHGGGGYYGGNGYGYGNGYRNGYGNSYGHGGGYYGGGYSRCY